MRDDDYVKAYVVGMIMSNVYKQAYKYLDKKMEELEESQKPHGDESNFSELICPKYLDDELESRFELFFSGDIRKLVIKLEEDKGFDLIKEMSLKDVDQFCSFLKEHFPDGLRLFSQIMTPSLIYHESEIEEISLMFRSRQYANIARAVFFLKTPCFSYSRSWISKHDFYFHARVFHADLMLALVTLPKMMPYIEFEIGKFFDFYNDSIPIYEQQYVYLANYIKIPLVLEKLSSAEKKRKENDFEKDFAEAQYLALNEKHPLIACKRIVYDLEFYKQLEVSLMKENGFFPIFVFPSPNISSFAATGPVFMFPIDVKKIELGDYLVAAEDHNFDEVEAKSAFDLGILEFYAYSNNINLFKRRHQNEKN